MPRNASATDHVIQLLRRVLTLAALSVSLLLTVTATAAPREIIIIRHADKLDQLETGPALSAQGFIRSIKFAFYFLEKFGEPDFIIAADDHKDNGREIAIRSIQTVAPLANMMQLRYQQRDYPILHPYPSDHFQLLANHLLGDQTYQDKVVLVCWSHQRIARLAQALGVTQPLSPWPKDDYDTVYVLKYDGEGRLHSFTELKNQFPVKQQESWSTVRNRLMLL